MALTFDREFTVMPGVADEVAPLIRRIVCDNPGPFTFTGTGTYIVGRDKVAVIDPGPVDLQHFEALMQALDGRTVTHIVITHTHNDHSPLAARLKTQTGAKTYAYGPHGAGRGRQISTSGDVRLDASSDTEFVPDITVDHGDIIEGDGWTLEAVFTPGHTANHMSYALKEENALFSGDHVMAWSTSVIVPPDGNMAEYFASLELLLGRREATYWPTHGPAKTNPLPFVRAFLTHRQMREKAILRRIEAGDRKIMDIVRAVYAAVDPMLHPAAAMSTLAHVEHLIEQGRVKTDGTPGLQNDYRAA